MSTERDQKILSLLVQNGRVTVRELAETLYVSEPSVRRDLARLEAKYLIKRVHGGAVLEQNGLSKTKIPFTVRELEQGDAKQRIARRAAALVEDGQVIFLDASTTAYAMIPYLADKKGITVITNGVRALERLAEYEIPAVATGGRLEPSCLALVGEEAHATVQNYHAAYAFFSVRGVSDDGYLTDIAPAENHVRRHMIARASRAVALCTKEKMGKKHFHSLCHRSELFALMVDEGE